MTRPGLHPGPSLDEVDIDFIPTEQYDATVAMRAIDGARECVAAATRVIVV